MFNNGGKALMVCCEDADASVRVKALALFIEEVMLKVINFVYRQSVLRQHLKMLGAI